MCMDDTARKMGEVEGKLLDLINMETAAGLAPVNARELSEAVDMLKDLAEAKYYCSVVAAMERESGEGGGMGYSPNRTASGRFAPSRGRMGYDPQVGPHDGGGYGMGYQRYQQARMGYTESKTAQNKRAMDEAAGDHLQDVMASVREIWGDADAGQRVQMKNALVGFVNELK